MKLSSVIVRIRSECAVFEKRVGGSFEFSEKTLPNADVKVPHCFVVPLGDVPENPTGGNADTFRNTESFAVIVCIDNKLQRSEGDGVPADEALEIIREQLFSALVGWSDAPKYNGMQYAGSTFVSMNNTRLWYQFTFSTSYVVTRQEVPSEGDIFENVQMIRIRDQLTLSEVSHATTVDGIKHTQEGENPTTETLAAERAAREAHDVSEAKTVQPVATPPNQLVPSPFHHGTEVDE